MFEPAVGTLAVTTAPVEVADALRDVVRPGVVRSAGGEWGWRTGSVAGLMEKATAGLVSTTLRSVKEITDFALRHGRKRVPGVSWADVAWSYSPTVAGSEGSEALGVKEPGLEERLSYSGPDSRWPHHDRMCASPKGSERPRKWSGTCYYIQLASVSVIITFSKKDGQHEKKRRRR